MNMWKRKGMERREAIHITHGPRPQQYRAGTLVRSGASPQSAHGRARAGSLLEAEEERKKEEEEGRKKD
jgi:hypothetical protein